MVMETGDAEDDADAGIAAGGDEPAGLSSTLLYKH